MTRLLDINVLVSLASPGDTRHADARHFFAQNPKADFATCPLIELGTIRILMAKPVNAQYRAAFAILQGIKSKFNLQFWPDDVPPQLESGISHPADLVDRYLVQLADRRGGKLLTFDRGIKGSAVEILK